MTVDMKGAARIAINYVVDMYSELNISNILLEEVERSDDGEEWLITVGFERPRGKRNLLDGVGTTLLLDRVYKVLRINSNTGEVLSVKIRAIP